MFPFQRISETKFKGKFAMNLRKLFSIFFITTINLLITFSASAQDSNIALEPLEVKAMRTSITEKKMPSSVTIITREDIEKTQASTVAEILQGALGVDVVDTGGFGHLTSVFMRASESNGVLAIIDGVRANWGSTGQFDFGFIPSDNIERIEIIRGPQSTLWGSDAMAGVINIVTRKGSGLPKHSISMEAGSYNTFKESMHSSGTIKNYDYSFGISRFDTEGFSTYSSWRGATERDAYDNTSLAFKLGHDISSNKRLDFVGNWTQGNLNYDNTTADDADFANDSHVHVALPFKMAVNDRWDFTLTPSYAYRDSDTYIPGNFRNMDKSTTLDLQNNLNVTDDLSLIFGGEYRKQKAISYNSYISSLENWSQYLTANYDYQNPENEYKNFLLTAGYRHDHHTHWGNYVTYKFGGSHYLAKTNTRFHASYATAFVSPTLDDLYSSSSNPNVTPETSKSFEFGLRQSINKRSSVNMTFFNDSRKNMIALDADWIPQNSEKVYSRGLETELNLGLPKNFNLALSHTWNEHYDQDNRPLIRRAKNKIKATLTHTWKEKLDSLIGLYIRGRATDTTLLKHTGGFTTVRAAFGYKYSNNLKLTLRAENLLDEEYEVIYANGTPGISGYAGFTYTFN